MKKLFLVLLAVLLSSTFSYSEQVKEESKAKEVQVKDTAAKTQTVEKETPTPEKKSKKAEKLTNTKTEKVSLSAVSSSASGKSGYSGNIQATQVNVEPFTGGANFAFPIPVLPGRGGIEPSIALTYSSSNRQLGTLGVGWSLELGSIQRSTKRGVPTYDDTKDTFILNFGGSVELVKGPAGTNFYYPKVEGSFSKIEKVADYWVITDKKGTQYYFGTEDTARQNDNGNQSKNFRWYLDTVGDVNGNVMKYTYIKEKNVIYPYIIKYGRSAGEISGTEIPYYAKVSFNYSPVDFNITSYMSGFEQVINKLLYSIDVMKIDAQGAETTQAHYVLSYQNSKANEALLLKKITQYGSQGEAGPSLPPVSFEYNEQSTPEYSKVYSGPQAAKVPLDLGFSGRPITDGNNAAGHRDFNMRVVDVNGDAFPDLVLNTIDTAGQTFREIYLNNKSNNWAKSGWVFPDELPAFSSDNTGRYDYGIRFDDVNGDGWQDIVWSYQLASGESQSKIYINNKLNTWELDPSWKVPVTFAVRKDGFSVTSQTTALVDLNGDGFSDIIKSDATIHEVYLSTFVNGNKGWEKVAWSFPADIIGNADLSNNYTLVDINSDGLPDLFYKDPDVTNAHIAFNNGKGFVAKGADTPWGTGNYGSFKDGSTQIVDVNGDGYVDVVQAKGSYVYGTRRNMNSGTGWMKVYGLDGWYPPDDITFSENGTRYLDANADGIPDMLKAFINETPLLYLADSKPINTLSAVDNGIGARTTIEYQSSASFKNKFLPFPLQVVKEIHVKNTANSPVSFDYVTKYSYLEGLWDAKEREFLGFNEVTVTDADGNYTKTAFLQDQYRKGRPYRQQSFDASGKVLSRTDMYWKLVDTNNGLSKFTFTQRADNYVYDKTGAYKRTAQVSVVDTTNGNVLKSINYGEISPTSPEQLLSGGDYVPTYNPLNVVDVGSDYTVQELMYTENPSKWLIGLPKRKSIQDSTGKMLFLEYYYYDGSGNYNSAPVKGMLTMKQNWDGLVPATSYYTKYAYDPFGNLQTTTDARNNTTRIVYDSTYKLFPVQVENALKQSSYTTYYGVNESPTDDARLKGLWGQTKSTKDINNQQSWVSYDSFGRAILSLGPLDSVDFPAATTEYSVQDTYTQIIQKVRIENKKPATIDTASYFDGLGRLIQSKSPSATPGQWIVSGQATYNNRGLVDKQYVPRYTTNGFSKLDPIDITSTSIYEQYRYDALGRTISVIHKDGTYNSTIYGLWQVTTIDENGHSQVSYLNSAGQLARKEEMVGADGRAKDYPYEAYHWYSRTLYDYDLLGNLIKVTDGLNNVTTIKYDALGRKIAMDDPDMGHWEYGYDGNGNLTSQKDNKGKTLYFVYDALNRLKNKTEVPASPTVPNPVIPPGAVNVNYTYDDPTQLYGLGRLNKASYGTDYASFNYDQLGREKSSTKTIDNVKYGVVRTYDAINRLMDLQYPNNAKVYYTYNLAGQINKVLSLPPTDPQANATAYVKDVKYNAYGQMTDITYGNGVLTSYIFNPINQRLDKVITKDATGKFLQYYTYTYDALGQVKTIVDALYTATQSFTYDHLNRLVTAQGKTYGTKTYSYDVIGNLKLKDGLIYTYGKVADKTGPHAVQSLSDGTIYKYDLNGNMTFKIRGLDQTEYVYDIENRLRQVYASKVGETARYLVSEYSYDGDGGRVKKTVYRRANLPNVDPLTALMLGDNYNKMQQAIRTQPAQAITTTYVGNLAESEAGRLTNFIYLGGQKVASVSGTDVFYYHTDHLGGLNVLSDKLGQARELTEIDPFGQTVRHEKFGAPSKTAWYYFTGKPFDDETGLYYYGARYYDPKLGRFITPDTIVQSPGNPQTFNRYSYCLNNPVNMIDPTGHKSWWKKFWGGVQDFVRDYGGLFGLAGGLANGIINNDWTLLKNQVIAGASAFVMSGFNPVAAMSAIITTGFLESKPGRQTTTFVATEVMDDMFGMRPNSAQIWARITLQIAGTLAVENVIKSAMASPIDPAKVDRYDPADLRHTNITDNPNGIDPSGGRYPGGGARNFDITNAKVQELVLTVKGQPGPSIAIGAGNFGPDMLHIGAVSKNFPGTGIVKLPFGNNLLDGYGTFFGVCHQASNATLLASGTSSTVWNVFPHWSTYATTMVYGNYGGQLSNYVYTGVNTTRKY